MTPTVGKIGVNMQGVNMQFGPILRLQIKRRNQIPEKVGLTEGVVAPRDRGRDLSAERIRRNTRRPHFGGSPRSC